MHLNAVCQNKVKYAASYNVVWIAYCAICASISL